MSGRQRGKMEEKIEVIKRLHLMDMDVEDIAKAVEMPINKVEEIINKLKKSYYC